LKAVTSGGDVVVAANPNNIIFKWPSTSGNKVYRVSLIDNSVSMFTISPIFWNHMLADTAGNLYVGIWYGEMAPAAIEKINLNGGATTILAQSASGDFSFSDNGGASNFPAIAVDGQGVVYIGDRQNNVVRQIQNGMITTIAGNGSAGTSGDGGPPLSASLQIDDIAADTNGRIFVSGGGRVRMISNGTIQTVLGGGYSVADNVRGIAALFTGSSIAVDGAGNIYFGESTTGQSTQPGRIRVLGRPLDVLGPPSVSIVEPVAGAVVRGTVPVLANVNMNFGAAEVQFLLDGFELGPEDTQIPYSVSWDTTAASYGSHVLTAVARNSAGNTSVSAGVPVTVNNYLVPAASAINPVSGIQGTMVPVTMTGSNFAGGGSTTVTVSGTGVTVTSVFVDMSGTSLTATLLVDLAAPPGSRSVTVSTPGGTSGAVTFTVNPRPVLLPLNSATLLNVTTPFGAPGSPGATDATGTAARFNSPSGVWGDGANVYVADNANQTIRKIVIATGAVTTLAGSPGLSGTADGTGSAARFYGPVGIWGDGGMNLYVTDSITGLIRKIVIATGVVTTLAGAPNSMGMVDGIGSAARFSGPHGIWGDGPNLYVADFYGIRKIVIATASVSTIAGAYGLSGTTDGTGSAARFNFPMGIWGDGANLWITEFGSSTIRKLVIASGAVTTFAGFANVTGSQDGTVAAARFSNPSLVWGAAPYLYVSDSGNNTIRRVDTMSGVVITVAGFAPVAGSADGYGSAARFNYPDGIWGDGVFLYVTTLDNTIRRLSALVSP
jgi:hypothetical protein